VVIESATRTRILRYLCELEARQPLAAKISLSDLRKQYFGGIESKDHREVELAIANLAHEFYREGIIFSGCADSQSTSTWGWPFFRFTEYGRAVASQSECDPHDRDGYLAQLRREIPAIDEVILEYIAESATCLKQNCILASAVMLGAATEKAMLLLIEAFGAAIDGDAKRSEFENATRPWMIAKKYDALWTRLKPLVEGKTYFPRALGEDLHSLLDGIFNLIRRTRNDAGHPSGGDVPRDVAHANLLLFRSHCRRVYDLIEYFGSHPVML
jgi:hypothetical protein